MFFIFLEQFVATKLKTFPTRKVKTLFYSHNSNVVSKATFSFLKLGRRNTSTILLCLFPNTQKEINSPGYQVGITFISVRRLRKLVIRDNNCQWNWISWHKWYRHANYKITYNACVFEVYLENFESQYL